MKKIILALIALTALAISARATYKKYKQVNLYRVALYDQFFVIEIRKGQNPVLEIDDKSGIRRHRSVSI